jgi:hypothetical protein
MDFINKTFKNRVTGDIITIIDQYQNVAITSNKEKINTGLLLNESLFTPVKQNNINESMSVNNNKNTQDYIDPKQFFDSQVTYNAFAETIKKTDLSKIKDEDGTEINLNSSYKGMPVATNESAVVFSDPQDEIEELKRKYGATTVSDSVRQQNETFARILEPETQQSQQNFESSISEQRVNDLEKNNFQKVQQDFQRPQVVENSNDPITTMFRNVKRNLDFKVNLKIDGKIPRLDFIEMMEDSYEISIIDFLAEEFTNKLLSDPSIIRNKIKDEINNMIQKKLQSQSTKIVESPKEEEPKVTRRQTSKRTSKKESTE